MADEQDDDDILFEQLAKRLEAVRRDVEMARSAVTDGTEGIRARLARIATDLHNLSSPLDTLNHRFKQQYAVNARLTKAAAKAETELKGLHQTIEALSQRIHEQAELLAKY